jgi:hypothetical protein
MNPGFLEAQVLKRTVVIICLAEGVTKSQFPEVLSPFQEDLAFLV